MKYKIILYTLKYVGIKYGIGGKLIFCLPHNPIPKCRFLFHQIHLYIPIPYSFGARNKWRFMTLSVLKI